MKSRCRRSRLAIDPNDLSADATELARRLIESPGPLPEQLGDARRLELAWALKRACYAAWSSEPRRSAAAAQVLQALVATGLDRLSAAAREIAALAAWTAGIAHVTKGAMTEAVASFDRAADDFRALDRMQHAAETQVPKIMALSMLGQHAAAAACAENTLREFLAQRDLGAAAKVSLNLGSLYLRQDAYAPAATYYREAAVLFARVGDMEHSVMADIGEADARTAIGDFDEAMRMYARARMRADTRGFPVLAAVVEESVALLQLVRGRYREALAGLEGSRRRYEALALPQHLAIAEKQLADAYLELRLLPEALAVYERILPQFETLDMPQERAWTCAQMGRTRALLGQDAKAVAAWAEAAASFAAQRNCVGAATVDLARAELAAARGLDDQAQRLAARAAQGFDDAGSAEGRTRADVVRAQALLRVGETETSRALFEATLADARRRQLLPAQFRCLTGRGLVAQQFGDVVAAKQAFEDAIELFEDQWRVLPGDEIRGALLTDHLQPYRELLRIALDAQAQSGDRDAAAAVLEALEEFRARTLSEHLLQSADDSPAADTEALRSRLNWMYRRLRRAQDEGVATAALVDDLRLAETELLERVRRHRLTAAPESTTAGAKFSVKRLAQALGRDSALIEYGVIDDELFACTVTAGGVGVHRHLARWPDVQRVVQSARFQIETLRFGTAPVAQHLESLTRRARTRLEQLHAMLWAPLADALAGYRKVLLVPHAQLALLPFAALHDGQQYLAEAVEVASAPSAKLASYGLQRQPVAATQALVLGESSSLAHAEREAQRVASTFARSAIFTGAQATVEALHANAGQADVIHLACHAQFRSDNPMFSALHLADGALTAESIERLRLRPGIVVLSACETGLAENRSGDEMVGLVRAFLLAGSARIVATLWPIDDETTSEFMVHFYSALSRGSTPSASLSAAQNALQHRHPHPYFWAGFTLFGGW